ncbi:hypothetical protein [Candidatus Thiothrix anitrata]|uniref:Uncharacterized protein n=1 Tax=Candidatus Thiothrix anitrata TaxID=2823902 RepID=A0ABX7X8J8_9GAMM|nr:hypothetical protein [Candidatus Thiothrix anitrata]QTR51551.1 hypothetical protein J8380_08435 [Candidatus Thiothrix anitrata]
MNRKGIAVAVAIGTVMGAVSGYGIITFAGGNVSSSVILQAAIAGSVVSYAIYSLLAEG